MRGEDVNLNFKAINKQHSGLIVMCLEIPHYSYCHRCAPFPDTKTDRQHQNIKYDKRTTYNRIPNC